MKKYRFVSDEEPSDEDLSELMKEVAKEAKIKYELSEKLFWENHNKIIKDTIKAFSEKETNERN